VEFKYQTLFTCKVPDGFKAIQSFNETIASDTPQTEETILETINLSFETAGVAVERLELSNDLTFCDVILTKHKRTPLRVYIRTRPSLVHDGVVYKLEELFL